MPPTANAGAPPARIAFGSLPVNVPLNGSGSTASAGSIITWAWAIKSKPPGSTAALSATNVANPTLNNVDLPGTYLIVLNVQQTDLSWAWDPDPASGGYENTPNTMPTARIAIEALQQYTTTVPPALGERTMQDIVPGDPGYMSAWVKTLELFEAVDAAQGEIDAFTAAPSFDDLYVDNVYEKTLGHTIVIKDDLTCEEDVFIATGKTLSTTIISTPLAQDLTIGASDDITITATDVLTMGAGGAVAIGSGAGQSVTISGGPLQPDIKTDVIAEATAAAGVTVEAVLLKDGAVTTTGTGAGGYVSTDEVRERTAANGVLVDQVQITDTEIRATRLYTPAATSLTVEAFDDLTLGATADVLVASGNDSVTVRGGSGDPDLKVDVIAEDTGGAGVTIDNVKIIDQGAGICRIDNNGAQLYVTNGADITPPFSFNVNVFGVLTSEEGTIAKGGVQTDTIVERTAGAGVTVESIRIENEGSNVYAFDVGTAASTLNMMANGDVTPAGSLTVNVYGNVYTENVLVAAVPIGVRPNSGYETYPFVAAYQGTITQALYRAAVAASSAGGSISVEVCDANDDSVIAGPESIDGVTEATLTIGTTTFAAGAYIRVTSDNADAVNGAGMAMFVRYTITGPA